MKYTGDCQNNMKAIEKAWFNCEKQFRLGVSDFFHHITKN